jgi:hypothetical protein
MVQVPVAINEAVVPDTEQTAGVVEAKLTGRPEVAVAESATVPPTDWAAIAPKVMVCDFAFTAKLWETGAAALYEPLPAWVAWMVQVPVAISEAVVPETEQTAGVVEAKLTGRPEVAVAESATVPPTDWAAIAPKVMVCDFAFTAKLWETGAAALYEPLPACVAWMVHVPVAISEAVVPETVQTAGVVEAKLTGRPESDVADSATVPPTDCAAIAPKVMVCDFAFTAKLWETGAAALYEALPAWVAWMVQVPAVISEAVVPETEQTAAVVEAKLTGRPESDVADSATVPPADWAAIAPKVMVCDFAFTAKL